jgi:hypothetical protein
MPTGTGIQSDTPVNLVIGAGVVLRAHAYVGASTDDNLFAVEREMFVPPLNGLMTELKGTDFITKSRARLEVSLPELSNTLLQAGIPGAQVDTATPGMAIISEAIARRIPDASYADWELDVERVGGGQFQFEIDDAINTGPYEVNLQDAGMAGPRMVLQARADAASPSTSPWRIRKLDTAS